MKKMVIHMILTTFVSVNNKNLNQPKEMMKAKHLLKYAIPALALAGLTLTACDKEKDKTTYRDPYEKELRFNNRNIDSVRANFVQKFAYDTACKYIFNRH